MVKLKFITRGSDLVLRVSENKERFYKSVKHLLKGNPNISRHWNSDKERFSSYAIFYVENNTALDEFKESYSSLIKKHPELSAKQIAQFYTSAKQEKETTPENSLSLVEKFLEVVVKREKCKSGCNYELYDKLLKKCRKLLPDFSSLTFQEIDFDKCVRIAHIFAKHGGYRGTTKTFRSLLGKADDEKIIDFSLSQIGSFKFSDYDPQKDEVNTKKPDVLSPEQLKAFLNLDLSQVSPTYTNRKKVELYYDFCVVIFNTFLAPCDVIKLKYKDITKQGSVNVKRKKTHKAVEVPLNPALEGIINKYSGQTKNGYVLPIMDDEKEKGYKTKDYTLKKFRERVNCWLKDVGEELKTDFDLYAYVFRHTAITVALDNHVPIPYVAMAAGTSIEMMQKHYYNGGNSMNVDRLQQVFLNAAI